MGTKSLTRHLSWSLTCSCWSVALVMNPKSGLVSPQFHVVFDDTFSTVPHLRSATVPSNWEQLVRNSKELVTKEDYNLARTWFDGNPVSNEGALRPRSEMPSNTKTIMGIWSFKRKRLPDGTLNKHKARLCAHGGMQQ